MLKKLSKIWFSDCIVFLLQSVCLTDIQTSNASIWRYHCLGEVVFLKIWNQYWLPSDTSQHSFFAHHPYPSSKLVYRSLESTNIPIFEQIHQVCRNYIRIYFFDWQNQVISLNSPEVNTAKLPGKVIRWPYVMKSSDDGWIYIVNSKKLLGFVNQKSILPMLLIQASDHVQFTQSKHWYTQCYTILVVTWPTCILFWILKVNTKWYQDKVAIHNGFFASIWVTIMDGR